jgi:hypothetical protein
VGYSEPTQPFSYCTDAELITRFVTKRRAPEPGARRYSEQLSSFAFGRRPYRRFAFHPQLLVTNIVGNRLRVLHLTFARTDFFSHCWPFLHPNLFFRNWNSDFPPAEEPALREAEWDPVCRLGCMLVDGQNRGTKIMKLDVEVGYVLVLRPPRNPCAIPGEASCPGTFSRLWFRGA